jgi:hypothetical protein
MLSVKKVLKDVRKKNADDIHEMINALGVGREVWKKNEVMSVGWEMCFVSV